MNCELEQVQGPNAKASYFVCRRCRKLYEIRQMPSGWQPQCPGPWAPPVPRQTPAMMLDDPEIDRRLKLCEDSRDFHWAEDESGFRFARYCRHDVTVRDDGNECIAGAVRAWWKRLAAREAGCETWR